MLIFLRQSKVSFTWLWNSLFAHLIQRVVWGIAIILGLQLSAILLLFNRLVWNHLANWNQCGRNVHLMVLYKVYVFVRSEIHLRLQSPQSVKKSVFFLCMWSIYFSSNFDWLFFFMLIMIFSVWSMPTNCVWFLHFTR
jgi:hypothetical protein